MKGTALLLLSAVALTQGLDPVSSLNAQKCNCNPNEAWQICDANYGVDDVQVAHEFCDRFYKCVHGRPVAFQCSEGLLYNPYIEQCDWAQNVDCGDRPISDGSELPDPDCDSNTPGGDVDQPGDGDSGSNGGNDDENVGGGHWDASEAPAICAADDSEGVLVAHENCNQFYICNGGRPVVQTCAADTLFNPDIDRCDWPDKVDCGDRVIPDPEDNDNGGNDNGGNDNGGNDNGGNDNGNGENGGGEGNDSGSNGGDGSGTCNCNPGEAPEICATEGSDGDLVAHENCNQFYKCAYGKPVAQICPGILLYNPYTEQCDWPQNVDCGDRVIPEPDEDNDNGGADKPEDNDVGDGNNEGGDNGGENGGGGTCNCRPEEAPEICATEGSDGDLVAHENCNQFYKCSYGKPVALICPGILLYNPYTEKCDWPQNVDCGDRIIPEPEEDNDNGGSDNGGGDNGGSDNGGGDNGGSDIGGIDNGGNDNNGDNDDENEIIGGGNCDPSEAPSICAADNSEGVLIAHENCNQFYICNGGKPVVLTCAAGTLFNPAIDRCDWPDKVDCGDRVIPDPEDNDNGGSDNGGSDNGGNDNGSDDNGGNDNGGNDNGGNDNGSGNDNENEIIGGGNCDPSEAPTICAADDSEGVLIAHENCNQFYICNGGKPVVLTCAAGTLFNPAIDRCDWPDKVDCGDRVIPDPEDNDNGGSDNGGNDNGGNDNGGNDNGGNDNGGNDNGGSDNGGGNDNENEIIGGGNCDPSEAPAICAADDSEGVLIAHENCNQFYICNGGKPVVLTCAAGTLFNPAIDRCDWPDKVDCGDRVIPDPEDNDNGGSDNGGNDNGGNDNGGNDNGGNDNGSNDNGGNDNGGGSGICNCKPEEAPGICAADGSDGALIAHENCNQFYKCAYGKPVALFCPGILLYNPYTEVCDWPQNVVCGDRIIPDADTDNDNGGSDNDDGNNGGDNGGGGNGEGDKGSSENIGGGNCDPSEAPAICAADDSEGVLVAHENCNQFYICNGGRPVVQTCAAGTLFNPNIDRCDWPFNVDCGDRVIPDPEDIGNGGNDNGDGGNGGSDNGGSDNGSGDNGGGNNEGGDGSGTCNCKPEEAPEICAADGSEGVLVAHENCNQFYKCAHGKPVAQICPGTLLYNPYLEVCDWPENVNCGDRVIPDPEDNDNGGNDNEDGGNGGGDNGGGNNEGGDGSGTCNCKPEEAPEICAADGSEGVLVAHENCNQFYKCAHGKPVAQICPGTLLYNPYLEVCDWPENVNCGDRVIPDPEDNDNGGNDNEDGGNGGGDNGGSDNGGGNNEGGDGSGICNCKPEEAPEICAADGSEGVLVAHENCNQFYKCSHGKPVAQICPGTLLYNPYLEVCDWPENVVCGDRVIPEPEDNDVDGGNDPEDNDVDGGNDPEDNDNGGGNDPEDNDVGGDNDGGDNNQINDDPSQAPGICAGSGSDGVLVAHENCNQYYMCSGGRPVEFTCSGDLLFNPLIPDCDWPRSVECGDRVRPEPDECYCDPRRAPALCSSDHMEGAMIAHENCNQFYICASGVPVARSCPGMLHYNPYRQECDWPINVDCDTRIVTFSSLNKHMEARQTVRN